MKNKASTWWSNVKSWWTNALGENTGAAITNFVVAVKNKASTWWKNVKDWWKNALGENTGDDIKKFIVAVADKSSKWWEDVQTYWKTATEGLSLGTAVDFVVNLIVNIAGKIWDGVTGFWEWILGGGGEADYELNGKTGEFEAKADLVPGSGWVFGVDSNTWGDASWGLPIIDEYDTTVNANPGDGFDDTSTSFKLKEVEDSTVKVNAVYNNSGGLISGIFSKIGEWLFGKSDTPSTDVQVEAKAGTGFSSVGNDGKMNLTGISDTNATIYLQQGNFSEGYKKWLTGDQYADLRPTVYLQNGNFKDGYKKWVTGDKYADLKSTVYLQNGNFKDGYKKWVTGDKWADLNSYVYLKNGNFSDGYKKWVTGDYWGDLNSSVYLKAGNFTSLSSWLGDSVTVSVNLKAGGGVAYSNGYSASFASGGVISSGVARHLSNIPHYASGTTDAHGTLFLAGEAGPEILGHVGGRTEILNQSQLASTMFAAVRSAMTGVMIGGSIENAVSMDNGDADYETMYRAMYDAFTDAMTGSNERDKEKVALMRQIAAKEFTAEVTAASVNRAQTRMNRRAGPTIVPVGT